MSTQPPKNDLNPQQQQQQPTKIKTLLFDLTGTCLDWHSAVAPVFQQAFSLLERQERPPFNVFHWRQALLNRLYDCYEAASPQEDVDEIRRRTLRALLEANGVEMEGEKVEECVTAWRRQVAWPDVTAALPVLRSHFDVIVLANGTTRNQLDMTKSANLSFDLLLSSELLGSAKPDPAIYLKAMELSGRDPGECLVVAAHADDLNAARGVGMRTAYIQRWTEDWSSAADGTWEETHLRYRKENDIFVDGRTATGESGGFLELAKMLGL